MKSLSFKHSGNIGDIIYSLPTVRCILKNHNIDKANFYLKIGEKADYYVGSRHPLGDIRLNDTYANALIPLLQEQSYIDKVEVLTDQKVEIDLDLFRLTGINYSSGNIANWYAYAFDVELNLWEPWLQVYVEATHNIVVARTLRYRNPRFNYRFLDKYKPTFLGLPEEFLDFRKYCPNAIYLKTSNFLEVAKIIKGAKLFIGNQCGIYSIAEGLKAPRLLEACLFAPNVIPCNNGRDVVGQMAFEGLVENNWKLIDKSKWLLTKG